jgi:predicted nucleic acid-binding Zn ribbon protein
VELLRDVIGRYLDSSGLGRRLQQAQLRAAWCAALGPEAAHTRLDSLRSGVATFVVDNAALLSELSNFRKVELLAAVQSRAAGLAIRDLRFRPGKV